MILLNGYVRNNFEASKCQKKAFDFEVDTGIDVRNIVSGIAESFKPEDTGKKSYCFSEPSAKKLRGVESQGMILMTTNAEENWFCNPDTDAANGEIN
jgi:methionyl-tRNA synthetase